MHTPKLRHKFFFFCTNLSPNPDRNPQYCPSANKLFFPEFAKKTNYTLHTLARLWGKNRTPALTQTSCGGLILSMMLLSQLAPFFCSASKVQHRRFTLCHFLMRGMNGRTTSHHYTAANTKFYSMNEILLPYTITVPVLNDFWNFCTKSPIHGIISHFTLQKENSFKINTAKFITFNTVVHYKAVQRTQICTKHIKIVQIKICEIDPHGTTAPLSVYRPDHSKAKNVLSQSKAEREMLLLPWDEGGLNGNWAVLPFMLATLGENWYSV